MVVAVSSGVVAVVVAAADETSHAEARRAKPSQTSQSREGLTNWSPEHPFGTQREHVVLPGGCPFLDYWPLVVPIALGIP